MNIFEQVEAVVALRVKALRAVEGFRNVRSYESKARLYWQQHLEKSAAQWRFMEGLKLDAHIGFVDGHDDFFKAPLREINMDYQVARPEAKRWLLQQIAPLLGDATERDLIRVQAAYRELLPVLESFGYSIAEVILGGFPREALDGLTLRYGRDIPLPGEFGLRLETLKASHSEDVVAMEKELFSLQPEHCWFFNNPGFCEAEIERLRHEFREGHAFGLFHGKDIKGYFSFPMKGYQVFRGRECGVDIAFHPDIQGKGLAIFAYKKMLEGMLAEGVEFFKGGTANPAVLALAKPMERPLIWYDLRKSSLCPDQQRFTAYL